MTNARKNRVKRTSPKVAARKNSSKGERIDERRQLCNNGEAGPIEKVSLPLAMITSLRAILLDFDPQLFNREKVSAKTAADPVRFYKRIVSKMLARHPAYAKAEVRVSGRGLHAILRFRKPIEFATDAERQRWAAIVTVIQKLLPTDPDCPGITASTRSLGSINSKNGRKVKRIHVGERVTPEDVVALFEETCEAPFRTVAKLLFGSETLNPCPVCNGADSKLNALDFSGLCYGSCGKVRIGQLFDVYLKPRPSKKRS